MNLKAELKTDKDPAEHIQSFFKSCGENGCYALCIIKAAKKWLKKNGQLSRACSLNYEQCLTSGIQYGWISFNFDNYLDKNNFFVEKPQEFMSYLILQNCFVTQESRSYEAKSNDIEIDFWVKSEEDGRKGIGHFVLPDDTDTIQNSITVKTGFIFSKRIFKIA